jgi:hypothetical protein
MVAALVVDGAVRRAEVSGSIERPAELGEMLAARLR